jgi:hypothetical protein
MPESFAKAADAQAINGLICMRDRCAFPPPH